jgi:DNA-binding CsgD family transcriptional regulator
MSDRIFSFKAVHDVTALSREIFRESTLNCFSYSRVCTHRSRAELWTGPDALPRAFIGGADDRLIRSMATSCHTKQTLPALSLARGPLTPRQLEIARHVVAGRTAREISQLLDLSRRTVETHVDNIKSRLGCMNKTELVLKLSHLGIPEPSQGVEDEKKPFA